jgi:DNA polymerase IIIc chi subunit
MRKPIEITVEIDISFITERFKKRDVQTIISDRLYQAGDAILRSLELQEEYEIIDVALWGALASSFMPVPKADSEPDILEAILITSKKKKTAEEDNEN